MEQAIRANGPVLYFFCSSASQARPLTSLIHTLLHQVVRGSSAGEANSIATAFLSTMVDGCLRLGLPNFRGDDSREILKRILNDTPDNEQVKALVRAIRIAELQEFSIIVDGLWEDFASRFIQLVMEGTLESKALFTTRHNPLQNIPHGMLCIEYDKERKGLHVRRPQV